MVFIIITIFIGKGRVDDTVISCTRTTSKKIRVFFTKLNCLLVNASSTLSNTPSFLFQTLHHFYFKHSIIFISNTPSFSCCCFRLWQNKKQRKPFYNWYNKNYFLYVVAFYLRLLFVSCHCCLGGITS